MAGFRLFADVIAGAAACVGCGIAFLQYQEKQEIKQVTINVQTMLVNSAKDGTLDVDVLNNSLTQLAAVTGHKSQPLADANVRAAPAQTPPTVETLAANAAPVLKRGELRLDEGTTLDLFKEGLMYTVDNISEDQVLLRDSSSSRLQIRIGEREVIPGTECSVDLIKTHPDPTYKKNGWAELRTWCP